MNRFKIIIAIATLVAIVFICYCASLIFPYTVGGSMVVLSIAIGFSYFLYKDIIVIYHDYHDYNNSK